MKKFAIFIASLTVLLIMTVAFITGCQKNSQESEDEQTGLTSESIPRVLYNARCAGLKIPDGTTTEILEDGATVRLTFPDGIFLVGNTDAGEEIRTEFMDYTCTGDCTKGCDVIHAQGSFGCSSCNPATITCTGKEKNLEKIMGKGFINLNAGINFVKNKKEASSLFTGPDILLTIPEVQEAMKAFNMKIHGSENPDFSRREQFREVGLNLFGCLVTYMAPGGSNPGASTMPESEMLDAEGWSCTCDAPAGSSGCTKESGMGYKKCVSGACTSCTMSINAE